MLENLQYKTEGGRDRKKFITYNMRLQVSYCLGFQEATHVDHIHMCLSIPPPNIQYQRLWVILRGKVP